MNNIRATRDYFILYVDDEEKSLKYFSRYFSRDYKILTAINSDEARKLLDERASEIGVIISDQRMPMEKGVELLKYARENYPFIVRLLTTAYSDLHDAIEAVNRGEILRYIPKPWDIGSLELELRQAMRFFQLNQDREQLRREKLSVAHRVTGFNRVKDLILMSAGMGHIRNPLQAIQACLLRFPFKYSSTPAEYRSDLRDLLNTELSALLDLAGSIRLDTVQPDSLAFQKLDLGEKLIAIDNTLGPGIGCNVGPGDTVIEAHPVLVERMLRLLLEHSRHWQNSEGTGISVSGSEDGKHLEVSAPLAIHPHDITITELPASILSVYFICYHHGGLILVDSGEPGMVLKVCLPRSQKEVRSADLPQHWQEEIFQLFEALEPDWH